MLSLHELLKEMIEKKASDLHITTGTAPQLRVDGALQPLPGIEPLGAAETKRLCYSILTDAQKYKFEEEDELDLSFGVKGLSRFRANIFLQRGAVAAAIRTIPFKILSFEELGLPRTVSNLCEKPKGLILVTGPTGSGKSTTLAAMIDKINNERHSHIVTVEDPIEYLHHHKRAVINQREVHADTKSFKRALKYVLRQDPDIVLIGEMRDLETMEAALTVAETGHLCFATLHTNSAVQSINRIIDVFPPHQQPQVRAQLSFVLEGVLTQQLIPRSTGHGRALCLEVMVPNAAIRNLIRVAEFRQTCAVTQAGQAKFGMQTMNQSLYNLFQRRVISREECVGRTSDLDELMQMMERGSGPAGGAHGGGQRRRSGRG